MAKITNQFINKGQGVRNRSYSPSDVEITSSIPNERNLWAVRHSIKLEIKAKKRNGEYQEISLTEQDIDKIAFMLVKSCGENTRSDLAIHLLENLADDNLHTVLADIFAKRSNKEKN